MIVWSIHQKSLSFKGNLVSLANMDIHKYIFLPINHFTVCDLLKYFIAYLRT